MRRSEGQGGEEEQDQSHALSLAAQAGGGEDNLSKRRFYIKHNDHGEHDAARSYIVIPAKAGIRFLGFSRPSPLIPLPVDGRGKGRINRCLLLCSLTFFLLDPRFRGDALEGIFQTVPAFPRRRESRPVFSQIPAFAAMTTSV